MTLPPDKRDIIVGYFRTHPVRAVYLFGSYARGDATEKSDIDLLLDADSGAIAVSKPRCKQALETLLQTRVDIHVLHTMSKFVQRSSIDERILLCVPGPAQSSP